MLTDANNSPVKMFDGIHLDLICSALDPVLFDVGHFTFSPGHTMTLSL